MKIYVIINLLKKNSKKVAFDIIATLSELGASVILSKECEHSFSSCKADFLDTLSAFKSCDAVLTIGGDGTILHAAKSCVKYDKPILGLNLGRMGFLATAEANEPDKLKKLVEGKYFIEKRVLLNVKVTGDNSHENTALNDVVISKNTVNQIMDIDVYCDDILVNSFRADGVVVATPTGSTAYSLSAGGPILDAKIEGIVVTPICAHSLHSAPMVFSSERNLRIIAGEASQISCDGASPYTLQNNETVHLSLSGKYVSLISFNGASQFEAIDKKLKGR